MKVRDMVPTKEDTSAGEVVPTGDGAGQGEEGREVGEDVST